MKRLIKLISISVALSMFLSSCGFFSIEQTTESTEAGFEDKYDVVDMGPVKGGSIRLFTTTVDTLNPILTNNIYVQDFLSFVYDGLFILDSTQQPIPVLAKSTNLSSDGLQLTIYIRDSIKWQDSMPLKPDDVVFTINAIKDVKNNSVYLKNVQYIDSATVSGTNAVTIKLKQPYSLIKNELTFPILPMHHFVNEKFNDKTSKANLTPIGTGPYRFVSYNAQSGVKLTLNSDWWNSDVLNKAAEETAAKRNSINKQAAVKLPYILNIEIKVYKNLNSANAAFQARDIDVLPAQYSEYRKYIGRTDINLKRYPGKNFECLALNIKKGPLSDKRVRNALNFLINKNQLIDSSASGIAEPAEIPVLPNSWVYQLVNLEQSYDAAKSKELLAKSGYIFDSGKNKYVKKNGKAQINLKLVVNEENSLRLDVAKALAAQLGKSGVNVEVVKIPWVDVQKTIKSGSYDLLMFGYRIASEPDMSFAYSTSHIQTGLNVTGYSNPNVDNYLQQILTDSNLDSQKTAYTNLINTVVDDRPYIGLFFINESMMYNKSIRGVISPYVWNKYNDISQWYLP